MSCHERRICSKNWVGGGDVSGDVKKTWSLHHARSHEKCSWVEDVTKVAVDALEYLRVGRWTCKAWQQVLSTSRGRT